MSYGRSQKSLSRDSILVRGGFTFFAHGFKSLLTLVSGFLVARLMGPENFGMMAFLITTFISFRSLIDLGTSSAFYTFLSGRSQDYSFFAYYFMWIGIQILLPVFIIVCVFPNDWLVIVWHQSDRLLILLACLAVFSQHGVWATASQIGDSYRKTYLVQIAAVAICVIHFVSVLILWSFDSIGVFSILVAMIFEHLIIALLVFRLLRLKSSEGAVLSFLTFRAVFFRYLNYCTPLIPYIVIGFVAAFGDRWILQYFGGNVEQAYYAIGWQFSAIALLATTAFLRIFWKEVAEANTNGDLEMVRSLYLQFTRTLYFISAAIACSVAFWAEELIVLTLGEDYSAGSITLCILFFIPLHQSLGQIQGSFLYATDNAKLLSITGSITLILGLVGAYLIMATHDAAIPGLHMGSRGLAAKMIFFQIVNVNVLNFLISSKMGWKIDWAYQLYSLAVCIVIAGLSSVIVRSITEDTIVGVILNFGVYFFGLGLVVFAFPRVANMSRSQLKQYLGHVRLNNR